MIYYKPYILQTVNVITGKAENIEFAAREPFFSGYAESLLYSDERPVKQFSEISHPASGSGPTAGSPFSERPSRNKNSGYRP
jgi:hypothetical protein